MILGAPVSGPGDGIYRFAADEACPSCTFWIGNVGHLSHLHARNTSLTAISRAPIEKLERYK